MTKVQSQIVPKTLSRKKKNHKNGASVVAQGVGPEFKPQYHKNKTKQKNLEIEKQTHLQRKIPGD
jgi:hypothetical protein